MRMTTVAPSATALKPNPNWAQLPLFDRSNWETVRFGDVVDLVSDTSRNPEAEGITRYIGLEHLEPGSLHIKTWGELVDGVTFTKRCRKGQVLFGKRRAYQRKVAMAEFEALVSGDIYVFQAKEELLDPKLLPFICMSERFFQFAVETSAGSLSPRTNWSHLKDFEFALPPLEQQRRIAELLWTVDDVLTASVAAYDQHRTSSFAIASALTLQGIDAGPMKDSPIGAIPASWRCMRIEELTEDGAYGPRFPTSSYTPSGNVYQIRTTDFDRSGGIEFSTVPAAQVDERMIISHKLITRDFLLSRSGEYAGLTAVFIDPEDGRTYMPGAFLIRYRLSEHLDPYFLLALCESRFGKTYVERLATGSAQPNISRGAFYRLYVPVPPVEEQRIIVNRIRQMESAGRAFVDHIANTKRLLNSLTNSLN